MVFIHFFFKSIHSSIFYIFFILSRGLKVGAYLNHHQVGTVAQPGPASVASFIIFFSASNQKSNVGVLKTRYVQNPSMNTSRRTVIYKGKLLTSVRVQGFINQISFWYTPFLAFVCMQTCRKDHKNSFINQHPGQSPKQSQPSSSL